MERIHARNRFISLRLNAGMGRTRCGKTVLARSIELPYQLEMKDQNQVHGFIDPPGPFASKAEWREFLQSIVHLPDDWVEVAEVRAEGQRILANPDHPAE